MSLSTLPDELLLHIFGYTRRPCFPLWPGDDGRLRGSDGHSGSDLGDLCAISLVSTSFHTVVEPILYAHFVQFDANSLLLFFRTLVARPHLAGWVKFISSNAYNTMSIPNRDSLCMFNDTEWAGLGLLVQHASQNRTDAISWVSELRRYLFDAYFALLLAHCSALQKLEFFSYRLYGRGTILGHRRLAEVFEKASDLCHTANSQTTAVLQRLHTIHVGDRSYLYAPGHELDDKSINFRALSPLLDLAQLRSLHCGLVLQRSEPTRSTSMRVTRTIKEFSLHQSNIGSSCFQQLHQCFPCLEKFTYERRCDLDFDVGIDAPFRGLFEALGHVSLCLQNLTVWDDSIFLNTETGLDQDYSLMGNFVAFSALHTMDMMAHFMKGRQSPSEDGLPPLRLVDVVPPNLSSLTLRACDGGMILQGIELVKEREKYAPKLERVSLMSIGNCSHVPGLVQSGFESHHRRVSDSRFQHFITKPNTGDLLQERLLYTWKRP